ncbi:MAG: hypothetical protein ACOVOC_11525, partial [Rhabdaerophilum sp.]
EMGERAADLACTDEGDLPTCHGVFLKVCGRMSGCGSSTGTRAGRRRGNRLAPGWAKRVAALSGSGKSQSVKQMILLLTKALIWKSRKTALIDSFVFQ